MNAATAVLKPAVLKPAVLKPGSELPKRLVNATRPAMAEVAPGRYVPEIGAEAPEMTVCTWDRQPDGSYLPRPDLTRLVRLTGRLIRSLGFQERGDTIFRLGRAGFIEVVKIAPHTWMLNIDSWFNHVRRCAEDPEFWDDDRRRNEYRRSL